jgi:transposase
MTIINASKTNRRAMGRHDFARRQDDPDRVRRHRRVRAFSYSGAYRSGAQGRGVKFGRPPKLSAEQIALIVRLADEGRTAPQIAETFGVHETTIYRCLGRARTLT